MTRVALSSRTVVPRWQTPLPAEVERAGRSWGPAIAAYARDELGIALDLWQRRAINRALAVWPDTGRLVYRIYVISTARQNGKTAIVRSIIGWALTFLAGPEWSAIAGLAHDRRQAGIPYRAVLADLRPMARRVGPIGRGGLALTRYLGIRSALGGLSREYHTYSREARDALRGESIDLGLFDEVRTQRDGETWAALEPTTTARPEPLILGTSTAGSDRSLLLREWWERGIRIIDGLEPAAGFGMTWYAADDELAPDDPRAIRQANPAIAAGRLTVDVVASSIYSLSPAAYRSERLNLWSEGADELLPAGTWARQVGPMPLQRIRVVLGVEAAPTWRRATVIVALLTDAGAWIGVAGELDAARGDSRTVAPEDLGKLIVELAASWHADAIAFSASSAAAPYAVAAAAAAHADEIAMTPRQVRSASQLWRSELVGGRLTHSDDPMVRFQLRGARPSGPLESGDWYLSIRESAGEVDAVRAGAWAAWAAIAPPERKAEPQVFV